MNENRNFRGRLSSAAVSCRAFNLIICLSVIILAGRLLLPIHMSFTRIWLQGPLRLPAPTRVKLMPMLVREKLEVARPVPDSFALSRTESASTCRGRRCGRLLGQSCVRAASASNSHEVSTSLLGFLKTLLHIRDMLNLLSTCILELAHTHLILAFQFLIGFCW